MFELYKLLSHNICDSTLTFLHQQNKRCNFIELEKGVYLYRIKLFIGNKCVKQVIFVNGFLMNIFVLWLKYKQQT